MTRSKAILARPEELIAILVTMGCEPLAKTIVAALPENRAYAMFHSLSRAFPSEDFSLQLNRFAIERWPEA